MPASAHATQDPKDLPGEPRNPSGCGGSGRHHGNRRGPIPPQWHVLPRENKPFLRDSGDIWKTRIRQTATSHLKKDATCPRMDISSSNHWFFASYVCLIIVSGHLQIFCVPAVPWQLKLQGSLTWTMTTRTSCWVNHGILLNDIYTRKNHPIEKTNHLPNLHFWGSKLISSQYLLRRPCFWCLVFRTTFSGDSWMYPDQCTPMGNPNISPSFKLFVYESLENTS